MSRLLDSLREVEQQRPGNAPGSASDKIQLADRSTMESGYFRTRLFWLIVLCGLIVGAFVMLSDSSVI